MRRRRGSLVFGVGAVIGFVLGAGAGCVGDTVVASTPALVAVGEPTIGIGGGMTFYGARFFPTTDSRTDIEFDGEFTASTGEIEPVQGLVVSPHREDGNTLVWTNFGPFANPFSSAGDRVGKFRGTVTAVNRAKDGAAPMAEARSRPLYLEIDVEPSLVVRELRPKDNATCAAPAVRVLGSFAYTMTVEAVGFTPVSFTFAISGEPGIAQPRIYRVPAGGQKSVTFGAGSTLFFFEPVPLDLAYYVASLDVTALDTQGKVHGARYNFGVHNPIEYITTGPSETAQVYAPESVSDCYAGGVNGSSQSWTESHEDSESRQVGTHWDQSWLTAHSVQNTHTVTNEVTMAVTDSSTNGWAAGWNSNLSSTHEEGDTNSWNWGVHADANVSVTGEVNGMIGIEGIAEVGAKVSTTAGLTVGGNYGRSGSHETQDSVTGSYGQNFEQNHSDTHAETVGHNYSTSDTEGWTYEQSETVAKGGDSFWQVSTANTTTHSTEVNILPGQQGMVYRQRIRLQTPGVVIAYDLCGEPQVVARAGFTDWKWSVAVEQGPTCPPPPVHLLPPSCSIGCGGQ